MEEIANVGADGGEGKRWLISLFITQQISPAVTAETIQVLILQLHSPQSQWFPLQKQHMQQT